MGYKRKAQFYFEIQSLRGAERRSNPLLTSANILRDAGFMPSFFKFLIRILQFLLMFRSVAIHAFYLVVINTLPETHPCLPAGRRACFHAFTLTEASGVFAHHLDSFILT
jgi:uncharacterized membrane protein YqaE (UPF0057 family)